MRRVVFDEGKNSVTKLDQGVKSAWWTKLRNKVQERRKASSLSSAAPPLAKGKSRLPSPPPPPAAPRGVPWIKDAKGKTKGKARGKGKGKVTKQMM